MLAVPLLVRGRTLGALTFGWQARHAARTTTRRSSPAQIARRVALALDNSALYQEAHGERERLAALVRQLPLGVIIAETSSRKLLFTNQRAQELLGPGASERSIAGPHAELIHRALEGESTSGSEIDVIRADGSRGIVSLSAEPVRDAGGEIVAAVATLFDLTEHRQREEALAFLAEASVVLTETLDLQHTLTELVELAVPRLADWCTIDMLDRGEIRNVGVAHADPETARLARRLHERRPVRAQASSGVSAALSTGRSQLIQDVPAWLAEQETPDEELLHALARARRALVDRRAARGPRARASARSPSPPRSPGRHFTEQDLAVAEDLARRAALAIENARLYGAEHDIAHALQQSLLPGHAHRSRRAPRSPRATARPARAPRWAATSTTRGRHDDLYFLAIGDVAGHGPAAAALTSLTRQAMRVVSRYERVAGAHPRGRQRHDPRADRARAVLHRRARDAAPDRGRLPAHRGLRRPSTAPSIVRAAKGEPEEIGVCGALLGVVADREYEDRECVLGVGDLVAFWTDGVTERRHARRHVRRAAAARRCSRGAANRPAADVAREIDEAVAGLRARAAARRRRDPDRPRDRGPGQARRCGTSASAGFCARTMSRARLDGRAAAARERGKLRRPQSFASQSPP